LDADARPRDASHPRNESSPIVIMVPSMNAIHPCRARALVLALATLALGCGTGSTGNGTVWR
jgi:hypothetical protein